MNLADFQWILTKIASTLYRNFQWEFFRKWTILAHKKIASPLVCIGGGELPPWKSRKILSYPKNNFTQTILGQFRRD